MKIIEVLPNDKLIVQFQDEFKYEKEIHYNNFKRGTVLNPYDKTAYNVGYAGIGEYETSSNGIEYRTYKIWKELLGRCYPRNEDGRKRHKAYDGCTICEEWKCYQKFAEWYEKNYYEVVGSRMHLDKDILFNSNKFYSPETCLIVPQRINMIFINKKNKWDFPSGVSLSKTGKYITSYNTKHLGNLDTLEDAISAHETEKRAHIRNVAEEYKTLIPLKVYNAILNW